MGISADELTRFSRFQALGITHILALQQWQYEDQGKVVASSTNLVAAVFFPAP